MESFHEKEIIEQAQKKPDAFALLYDRYYSAIFNYVLRRIGNRSISQDITSETFLKAFKKIPFFRWKNIPFSAWLYRIASNEVNMYYRSKKYRPEILSDNNIAIESQEEEKDDELEFARDLQRVLHALRSLDLRYQEVISLKYLEKLKVKEIALIVNKKEGTVKSLISRGLDKLREQL